MGTRRFIMLKKTHFEFLFGFLHGFLYRNMFPVIGSSWVFLSNFIIFVLGSIFRYFLRFLNNRYLEENKYGAYLDSKFDVFKEKQSSDIHVDEDTRKRGSSSRVTSASKYEILYGKGISRFVEEPKTESFTMHEFCKRSIDYADCDGGILVSSDSDTRKIEFQVEDAIEENIENFVESSAVEKVLDHFYVVNGKIENSVEEEEDDSVDRFGVEKNGTFGVEKNGTFEDETEDSVLTFSFANQIKKEELVETKSTVEEKAEDSVGNSIVETISRKAEQDINTKAMRKEKKAEDSVEKLLEKPKQEIETAEESIENYIIENILEKHVSGIENNHHDEEKFGDFFDSPVIEIYLEKWKKVKEEFNEDGAIFSPKNKADVESTTYELLANNKFDLSPETRQFIDRQKVENMENVIHESNTSISDYEAAMLRGLASDSDEEFIELEPQSEKLCVMAETRCSEDETKEPTLREDSFSSYEEKEEEEEEEEDDDSEFGSEPDELIERLKEELKVARAGGLPTILEESESLKMVEKMGPFEVDEKYDYKHHMAEIQKVYKSYSDKMRKLDILNSQTMHGISLLQLKDPDRLNSSGKPSAPAIKSLFSNKVLSLKQQKPEVDPAMRLLRELHKDFETVYVGQVCLSWEMLHWQFGKVKNLLECDSQGFHQYNQVAGEFQHFQVLLQRFLEDEPFQTKPRVENYVKNRCAVRHLLQVPVIKDDCSKYKEEDGAVSSEMLTDIIGESMHIFWEFLRPDKDESSVNSKTPQQARVAPHDPVDLELLMNVRTDLQKKEKRLKEIQRITNCIIKKFQKQHQGGNLLDHSLFIAQVEVKLVSRVLNMLKITTEHLVWCHEKLQKINISSSSRKIEIEPSFTLFPC